MTGRTLERAAWSCLGAGIVGSVVHVLGGATNIGSVVYGLALLAIVVSTVISATRHQLDRRILSGFFVIIAAIIIGQLLSAASLGAVEHLVAEVAFFVVQITLVLGLLLVAQRRIGREPLGILADASILSLGAWLVVWIVVLRPLFDTVSNEPFVAGVRGLTFSLSAVVLFLLVTLLLGDSDNSTVVWLASSAILSSLIGDVLWALHEAEVITTSLAVRNAPYVMALFAACATLLHPGIRNLTAQGSYHAARPMAGRLVVVISGLVVPIAVFALTDAQDTRDRIVRTVSVLFLSGVVLLRVVIAVRANAQLQSKLIESAQTDALTGLANRSLMLEHVDTALRTAWRDNRQPTVLFIDVDRFKNINDSLGHAAGDDVLIAVATRLRLILPTHCVVGRIAGDEFVVLDPQTNGPNESMVLADRVLESFHEPLALRQGDVFVSASIGVSTYRPSVTNSADDLLRHADTAMYRAKESGRNCVAIFDESMLASVTQRLAVETALYRALERRELRLVHQPIIDVGLGEVVGFEALMRWDRDDGSSISPAEFIPIAEETGTIVPIGAWALLEALTHLGEWIASGVCPRDATMAVNVSPRQLSDPNFVNLVSEALTRAHIPARQLWLEVTEGVMIAQPDQALDALTKLCDLGVRVAIDDFGTGYSSLSLLQKFPIHCLKIDRSFISGVADNADARSLVRTIIAMCESMGLDIVAEGVESVRQLQVLGEMRCAKAQGYLISHPVPPESIASTVATINDLGPWPRTRRPS
ncbi:MAG: EAL domain-containing protein [Ilumatobacteraceae bacterium]|nr:EAL domain-containing protein [Ilumatobacteraceae bacterium]